MGHGRGGVDFFTQRSRARASKEKFLAELRKKSEAKARKKAEEAEKNNNKSADIDKFLAPKYRRKVSGEAEIQGTEKVTKNPISFSGANKTVFSKSQEENEFVNIDEFLAPEYRRQVSEEPSSALEQPKPPEKEESTGFWSRVKGFFGASPKQQEEKPKYTRVRPLTPEELERYKAEHPESYPNEVVQKDLAEKTSVEIIDKISQENNIPTETEVVKSQYSEEYVKEELKSVIERVQAKIKDGDKEGAFEDLRFAMVDNFDKPELTSIYGWALKKELGSEEEKQLLEEIQTKFKNGDEESTYKDINRLYWSLHNELNNKKAKQFKEEVQIKLQNGDKEGAYEDLKKAMIECPTNEEITSMYWSLSNELNSQRYNY